MEPLRKYFGRLLIKILLGSACFNVLHKFFAQVLEDLPGAKIDRSACCWSIWSPTFQMPEQRRLGHEDGHNRSVRQRQILELCSGKSTSSRDFLSDLMCSKKISPNIIIFRHRPNTMIFRHEALQCCPKNAQRKRVYGEVRFGTPQNNRKWFFETQSDRLPKRVFMSG